MDLKINFSQEKIKKIERVIANFWLSKNIWIFLIIWIGLASFVFTIWFSYLFSYEWSNETKQQYIRENGQGIVLNEGKQKSVLDNMTKRKEWREAENKEKIENIFGI